MSRPIVPQLPESPIMKTTAVLAAALLAAAPAAAQLDAPSRTDGFFVGLNLVGATFDTDADDDFDAFTGGGAGLEVGWGFSSGIALFLSADAGSLEADEDDTDAVIDQRAQADLGMRVNF